MSKQHWESSERQPLKLRQLSDDEFERARKLANDTSVPMHMCPTCKSIPEEIPDSGGVKERKSSTYKLYDEVFSCDCERQIKLRRHYLAANIGNQYQELDWSRFTSDPEAKAVVNKYIDNWESYRDNGMGLTFYSEAMGTGKTFMATHVGKELIKQGQKVYFIPFVDLISAYEADRGNELEERMKATTYLILDDILESISERQRDFYGFRLESIIRHRTNFNLPTLVTTNLVLGILEQEYPRTFSLLSLKQIDVPLHGGDARGKIKLETEELAANGEKRPIT